CFRLRERLLRLNARLTGHRLLRGAIVAGGVAGPIASADLEHAARDVDRIVDEFLEVARLSLDNTMVLERLQGTGRLTTRTAPAGPLFAAPGPLRPGAYAVSLVEGWRGPIWHWALAGAGDSLTRVKIVDASFRNWAALEYAVLNNIVPDFPLCNKSFNLSYSGNDL